MSGYESLAQLQQAQQRHDEKAHTDILCLSTQRRVTHLVLHLAKYAGRLIETNVREKDKSVLLVTDTEIVALSCANALGVWLPDALSALFPEVRHYGLPRLSKRFAKELDLTVAPIARSFGVSLAVCAGYMAKACEALDHLEPFDYHATLARQVTKTSWMAFAAADHLRIDLSRLVRQRWAQVEARSAFREAQPAGPPMLAKVS